MFCWSVDLHSSPESPVGYWMRSYVLKLLYTMCRSLCQIIILFITKWVPNAAFAIEKLSFASSPITTLTLSSQGSFMFFGVWSNKWEPFQNVLFLFWWRQIPRHVSYIRSSSFFQQSWICMKRHSLTSLYHSVLDVICWIIFQTVKYSGKKAVNGLSEHVMMFVLWRKGNIILLSVVGGVSLRGWRGEYSASHFNTHSMVSLRPHYRFLRYWQVENNSETQFDLWSYVGTSLNFKKIRFKTFFCILVRSKAQHYN